MLDVAKFGLRSATPTVRDTYRHWPYSNLGLDLVSRSSSSQCVSGGLRVKRPCSHQQGKPRHALPRHSPPLLSGRIVNPTQAQRFVAAPLVPSWGDGQEKGVWCCCCESRLRAVGPNERRRVHVATLTISLSQGTQAVLRIARRVERSVGGGEQRARPG